MSPFSTSSSKEELLEHLQPVSKKIRDAMNRALPEARRVHHSLGLSLESGRSFDPHYFAYTMRVIAKRNLAEIGVEAEIEDDYAPRMTVESAALGGLVLKTPGFMIRILKPDAKMDLPKAASESRAQFYEQQLPLPFPHLEGEPVEEVRDLAIVYLWEVNPDFTGLTWQVAMPMDREGNCFWKASLKETGPVLVSDSAVPMSNRPSLATIAAIANTDLEYSPKTSKDEERGEPQRKGASNGA